MAGDSVSKLIEARAAMLHEIQTDKGLIALSSEEVALLDRLLVGDWGVDFNPADSFLPHLQRMTDRVALDRFETAFREVSSGRKTEDSSGLYSAMAHPDIIGPVTSHRRHLILDTVAMAIGLYRHLGLEGGILDAGCHIGIMSNLLATTLEKPVIGIDPSADAISFGRSHAARHNSVDLIEATIPWQNDLQFDMVIAASVLPGGKNWEATSAQLRNIGALLAPGGIAIIMSAYLADADPDRMRRTLRTAKLGFGYADVAGGYGGLPPKFEAEGIVVLLKDSTKEFPRKVRLAMESEWDLFKDYANTPGCSHREKTQAFERAYRKRVVS